MPTTSGLRLTTAIVLGVAVPVLGTVSAHGGEKVLHQFHGGNDGASPSGGVIIDAKANFYGTTSNGGTGTKCDDTIPGCGTVYEIKKGGGEKVLYSFQDGSDGAIPSGSLLLDSAGNLYGAAEGGGTSGDGVIFKLAPNETLSVLYTFQGGSDGYFPNGSLIADASGNLYGETWYGGNYNGSACAVDDSGCGTVFELQPNGTKITLYAFQGGSDGDVPRGGLVADASGNLYGTTGGGGTCNVEIYGCGTVFKIASGGTESVLYAFQGGTDGQWPYGGVIIDGAGNLYGTTELGGSQGAGTIFKIAPNGTETVLYSFKGGKDGVDPQAGLVTDANGTLYGTTEYGGNSKCLKNGVTGCGTVFELTANGEEKVLYTFNKSRGENPAAPLLLSGRNELYGTTTTGNGNYGVVFSVKAK
ncbi:MAG: choice-of-anchor tandem repeat GloVer-containing protein [Rhizomicrobium sp.]|jgi:uncharacterized repeat protein (TIGR03803 family)